MSSLGESREREMNRGDGVAVRESRTILLGHFRSEVGCSRQCEVMAVCRCRLLTRGSSSVARRENGQE